MISLQLYAKMRSMSRARGAAAQSGQALRILNGYHYITAIGSRPWEVVLMDYRADYRHVDDERLKRHASDIRESVLIIPLVVFITSSLHADQAVHVAGRRPSGVLSHTRRQKSRRHTLAIRCFRYFSLRCGILHCWHCCKHGKQSGYIGLRDLVRVVTVVNPVDEIRPERNAKYCSLAVRARAP
ncbi:hypothetical protein EVAR_47035_1 [Eumeta japonica]|uniref:Uncharacterized protein n=1 Tax=Eumeta variegata TaxID=151549 RepID=A0A4C1XGQ3_EUMVA|nr:hypothetical protein EVAR_47035_1 [Eumeta japonica]